MFRPPNCIVHKCQRIAFKKYIFLTMYFFFSHLLIYFHRLHFYSLFLYIIAYFCILRLSYCSFSDLFQNHSYKCLRISFTNTKSLLKFFPIFYSFLLPFFLFNYIINKYFKDFIRHICSVIVIYSYS